MATTSTSVGFFLEKQLFVLHQNQYLTAESLHLSRLVNGYDCRICIYRDADDQLMTVC
jgi:hypothetical protein